MEDIKKPKPYFTQTHLDSPIIITPVTLYEQALETKRWTHESSRIQKKYRRTANYARTNIPAPRSFDRLLPEFYPTLYHKQLGEFDTLNLDMAVTESLSQYNTACIGMHTKLTGDATNVKLANLNVTSQTKSYYKRWLYWDTLVDRVEKHRFKTPRSGVQFRIHNTVVWAMNDLVWIQGDNLKLLCLFDQILMIKDLLYSRFLIFLSIPWVYPDLATEMEQAVTDHIHWHESCLSRYGNKGFGILKYTEAMCKSYLSVVSNDRFGTDGSFYRVLKKISLKETELEPDLEPLCNIYAGILSRNKAHIEVIVELFGLYRVSGHPLIDPALGGRAVQKEIRAPNEVRFTDCRRLRNNFCRMFTEGYIKSKGKWPELLFPENYPNNDLKRLHDTRNLNITRNSYHIDQWETVRFKPMFDFNFMPNYLELMDDKSLAYYRSEFSSAWFDGVEVTSERRLLLELLSRPTTEPEEIMHRVRLNDIPWDWKVICLNPKEREHKEAARLFAMLPYEMRLAIILSESNVAEHIFPYIPQQGMMRSKLEMDKIFHELTKHVNEDKLVKVYSEIDLSKWNLKWTEQCVNPIGTDIEDLTGLPGAFTYAHQFFEESMIVIRTNDLPPEGSKSNRNPPESDLLWYNHTGGFEGLLQKLWTLCTFSMIDLALLNENFSYKHLGQGDNQIIAMLIPLEQCSSHEDLLTIRDRVCNNIEKECALQNQEAKFDECIESTTVITFSKNIYVNGVDYHPILKFVSRMMPSSSTDFPSVRTNLGSLFSASIMVADKMHYPVHAFLLGLITGYLYMFQVVLDKKGIHGVSFAKIVTKYQMETVRAIMRLPSELGGYPIATIAHYMYRSGSDPLSKSIAGLYMSMYDPACDRLTNRLIRQVQDGYGLRDKPQQIDLLSDPYSIPLATPSLPSNIIADHTLKGMHDFVKNRDIKELISVESTTYHKELIAQISKISPFNPLIGRDILDCSSYGIKRQIEKMFVNTRSVQSVVRESNTDIVGMILKAEERGFLAIVNRVKTLPASPAKNWTIYSTANYLRSAWNRVFDQPIVGVTNYTPFDFQWEINQMGSTSVGIEVISGVMTYPPSSKGPHRPYFGSMTLEKRHEHGYKIEGHDNTSVTLRKLQLILSQCGSSLSMKQLINSVSLSRSDLVLSTVSDLLTGVKGGTLSHRYAARVGSRGTYNLGSVAFLSWCLMSSDNAGFLSGSPVDYPVMFQEFFLLGTSILRYSPIMHGGQIARCVIGDKPLVPLEDIDLSIDDLSLPTPISYRGNNLAFLDEITLRRITPWSRETLYSHRTHEMRVGSSTDKMEIAASWAKSKFRAGQSGRRVADAKDVIELDGVRLDILEVKGFKISILLQGSALGILQEALVMVYLSPISTNPRWRLRTICHKLAKALSRELTSSLSHPLIQSDPFVIQWKLYPLPKYTGAFDTFESTIQGVLTHLVDRILYDHDLLGSAKIHLYPHDASRTGSESIIMACCLRLCAEVARGGLTSEAAHRMARTHLVRAVRGVRDEDTRIERLLLELRALCTPQIEETYPLFVRDIQSIVEGHEILTHSLSLEEELRAIRDYAKPDIALIGNTTIESLAPRRRLLDQSAPIPVLDIDTNDARAVKIGFRNLCNPDTDHSLINMLQAHRSYRKVKGGISSGQYHWIPLLSKCDADTVLVVGSGAGSCSQVLLDSGTNRVIGLDLRSTIPMSEHRYKNYKPPLVMESVRRDHYIQSDESIYTTGDWTDCDISVPLILRAIPDLVVIDIEENENCNPLKLLTPLIIAGWTGTVILRCFLRKKDLEWIVADMAVSRIRTTCTALYSVGTTCEVAFIMKMRTQTDMCLSDTPGSLDLTSLESEFPWPSGDLEMTIPGTESDIFNVILLGSGFLETGEGLNEAWDYITGIFIETVGDYESRLSFYHWSHILYSLATIHFIKVYSTRDWGYKLKTISTEGQYNLRYRRWVFQIKLTKLFSKLLFRYAPRLL
jgi:hypothetical protein